MTRHRYDAISRALHAVKVMKTHVVRTIRQRNVQPVLVALLFATLVASVLLPARESWRTMHLLGEISDVIEPARLLAIQLQEKILLESSMIQAYTLSGDGSFLEQYRLATVDDGRDLASLALLARRLPATAGEEATRIGVRVGAWRDVNRALVERPWSRSHVATEVAVQDGVRDAIIREIDAFGERLAGEAAMRRDEVRAHERLSVFINAALVLVASAGLLAVISLARRERRLAHALQRLHAESSALAHEKARLLDEAHERRQRLERVMKSREHLMRGFSHDVKNPVGAVDGYAELLLGDVYGQLSPAQTQGVERIRRSARRALALIEDLHELARTEAGTISLDRSIVDLGDLVRTSGEEYRAAAQAKGLTLDVQSPSDPLSVETDGARVRQIVGNLVSNAIKYTTTGGVVLCARPVGAGSVEGTRGWAVIEVLDTGPGIPADQRDLIFEEFSRLDAADTRGAGVGLAISKRLAAVLGGRISVESEVGRGSTFTLWIPTHARELPVIPRASHPAFVAPGPGSHERRVLPVGDTGLEP